MESVIAPYCIFYHMLFHCMTCSSSFLMNTVTPNIDLARSLTFLPLSQSSPVIAISLFLCLHKSLWFFLESSFLITVYKSEYKQKYEIAPDVVIQWKVVELYTGKKKMPIKDWIILYPRKVVQWKQQRLCSFFLSLWLIVWCRAK